MALKIRMRQQGRNNRPFYRIVVTDCRSPRDGKYVEMVGWYNPFEEEADKALHLDAARVQHWLGLGAQLSESVEALVAKAAPHVTRWLAEKRLASRTKLTAQRRARRKAAAA